MNVFLMIMLDVMVAMLIGLTAVVILSMSSGLAAGTRSVLMVYV